MPVRGQYHSNASDSALSFIRWVFHPRLPSFTCLPVCSCLPEFLRHRRLFISRHSHSLSTFSPPLSTIIFSVIKRDNFKKGPLNLLLKLLS